MKTSFYFLLWIIIYPILGWFNSPAINEHSFLIAIIFVFGISWLLNTLMPKTLAYEQALQTAPIMENVYTGNVAAFRKRLSRDAVIETLTALYLIVATFVTAYATLVSGVNDWLALIIFALFAFGTMSRSASLLKGYNKLRENPTPEQCAEIAESAYKLDYNAFFNERSEHSYQEMFPPRPRYFRDFQGFSLVVAIITTLLGIGYIAAGLIVLLAGSATIVGALAGMYFLYGSLAFYYGLKDFLSSIPKKKSVS